MRYPFFALVVSALIAGLMSCPQYSLAATTLHDQLEACRSISDAIERLGCYDGIGLETLATDAVVEDVQPATVAAAEASETPEAAEAAEVAEVAEENFGYEFSVKDVPEKLTSTVVSVRKNAKGGLVVTLANGQVWQQSGTERLFLDAGESVTILRGAFSAFYLVVNDKGRRYRFARVD